MSYVCWNVGVFGIMFDQEMVFGSWVGAGV